MSYQDKYLKYKNKYLLIKKQFSATITDKQQVIIDNLINERPIMEEKINNKMWGGMERNWSLSNATSAESSAAPIDRSLAAASSAAPIDRSLAAAASFAAPIDRSLAAAAASSAVPIDRSLAAAASSAVPIDRSLAAAASFAAPIDRSLAAASSAVPIDRLPAGHTGFIQKEYRDNLFEINNYEEILLHIFNGNDKLNNLAGNNHREIIGLINFIEKNYPTENKYYFIICISFCFTDSPCDIIEYLISKLGLDRLIQIVYEINYGSLFNQIIYDTYREGWDYKIRKLDERKISVKRILIFHKLLECYSKKPQIQFEELLMKLFSIQNNLFMSSELLTNLINFLVRKEFKLFEFLLENKSKLINFIRLLKENIRLIFISRREREIIGTTEQQSNLFSNI